MNDTFETFSEREEIEMLLPWYATGKLSREDHDRVERYIAEHPELVHQLELVAEELGAAIAGNEAIRAPRGLSTAATLARVAGGRDAAESGGLLSSIMTGLRNLLVMPSSGGVRWAGAAAALLILAQAGVIASLVTASGPDAYQPASGGRQSGQDGSFALVRFQDAATVRQTADLLTRLGMTIVDGPKPGGLYRVRIGDAALAAEARAERIAALKAAAGIVQIVTPAP